MHRNKMGHAALIQEEMIQEIFSASLVDEGWINAWCAGTEHCRQVALIQENEMIKELTVQDDSIQIVLAQNEDCMWCTNKGEAVRVATMQGIILQNDIKIRFNLDFLIKVWLIVIC
ncbi:unnamed protein product [Blepharisma stoltei]|uniref:Uncharacterized protein n=1 Tax=Blepharisma stoltei TaxID=1481888 RepID=A0AAU9JFZ2_9CILI|nr:unnamed protein product [Blepharisma stoltei]CAG9322474.1 unnamed protein product [Blepharisma stoltei]